MMMHTDYPCFLRLHLLVRDMLPAIETGVPVLCAKKSAHDRFALLVALQNAQDIAHHRWGGRGIISAFERMATLTPALEIGLGDGKIRSVLRDKGYQQPTTAWRAVFRDFAETTPHLRKHSPVWTRITSC